MPTLYLHIGTPKTGTTAIQDFCYENSDVLARQGLFFPMFPEKYEYVPERRNAYFLIAEESLPEGCDQSPEKRAVWRKNFDEIERLLQIYPNVLLSDETIWNAFKKKSFAMLQSLKAEADAHGFEVKIIVYLRRQDEFVQSHWAQRIKANRSDWGRAGESWRIEDAVATGRRSGLLDYYARLEKIASIFGRDHIIVRVYDRSRFKEGDVIADFLDIFGLRPDERFVRQEGDVNLSLGGNALEIKRILNPVMDSRSHAGDLLRKVTAACYAEERKRATYSMLSEEEIDALLEEYAESNRMVARDYLGDENIPLFSPPHRPVEKWSPDNPYMYESIIRFFGMLAVQQQKEIEELKSKLYLRRKLRRLREILPQRLKSLWRKSKDE